MNPYPLTLNRIPQARFTITPLDSYPVQASGWLKQVLTLIQANIGNAQFGVPILAEEMHLSRSQLNRRLQKIIACSAGQLIRQHRMQHALALLADERVAIQDIASLIGYLSHTSFCRSFRQQFGCAPSTYRQELLQRHLSYPMAAAA